MSDIAGPVSEGNKGQPAWEAVTDGVDRLPIPGGWITEPTAVSCLSLTRPRKFPTWIPGQSASARRLYYAGDDGAAEASSQLLHNDPIALNVV